MTADGAPVGEGAIWAAGAGPAGAPVAADAVDPWRGCWPKVLLLCPPELAWF